MSGPLLEARDLTIQYQTPQGLITAVSDASFIIEEGEYFGLVGESGCGKSTIAQSIIGGLPDNGQIQSGELLYSGEPIHGLSDEELNRKIRWKEISFIPQGSMNSLDPLEKVSDQAVEIARSHGMSDKKEVIERLSELFEIVGLSEDRISEYPHQFSGGMQQRAIIALSLLLDPSIIIADEPTTALDVIMQDQIFKYLDEVRDVSNVSVLLITHDISLIFESCERLAIMHAGQIAETGKATDIFENPRHPYTILLQEAFPDVRYPNRKLETIDGDPPQNFGNVDYCTFAERCPWAIEECRTHSPILQSINGSEDHEASQHRAACFRKDEVYKDYESNQQIGQGHDD
jgi:oligopeptide/dipeptide ABC transporter ATP-binding protein